MTSIDDVTDTAPRVQYTAIAAQVAFTYDFPLFSDSDIVVDVDGVTKTLTTDYTVSGVGNDTGGTVTFGTAPGAGAIVTLYRDTAIERLTDFQQNGPFSSTTHNDELDKITTILLELENKIGRCIRFPLTGVITNAGAELSPISTYAGKFLRVTSGGLLEAAEVTNSVVTLSAAVVGALLYPQTSAESSAGVTPSNYVYPEGDVRRYGAVGDGATNDTAAFTSAVSVGVDIFVPEGDFLVTSFPTLTGDANISGPGRITTASSHRRTWEIDTAETWYVNASTGDDSNDGKTSGTPFLTINRAIQQLEPLLARGYQQTIQLADGTYTASDIAAGDMPRPALVYITNKYAAERSYSSGGDLYGSLVIKGTSTAGTIIECGANFTYGVYVSQVPNVALQDLTIRGDGVNAANSLVTAHRGSYVQLLDVTVDGQGMAAQAIVAEAGGVCEVTGGSTITDCTTNVVAFDESLVVLSNTTAVSVPGTSNFGGRGTITLNNTVDVQGASLIDGLTLVCNGTDTSNRVTMQGAITADNAFIKGTFTDWSGAIDATLCNVHFNVCNWSEQITMRGGAINLEGACNTYISPGVASNVANPLALLGDAQYYTSSSLDYTASGSNTSPTRNTLVQAVSANSTAINFQATAGGHCVTELTANGSYTGCTLAASSSDFSQPPNVGDKWTIIFSGSNDVALVDSSTADIASGGITLGLGASEYNAITFVWRSDRLWHEIGRSAAN